MLELRSCNEMLELSNAMAHLQQIEMFVDKYAVEPLEPLLVSGRKRLFTDIELKQATGTLLATALAGTMRSQLLQLSEPTTEVPSVDAHDANGVPSTFFAQRNAAIGSQKHKRQKTETTMGHAPLPYEHLSTFPRPGLKESKIFIPDLLRPYVSLTPPEARSKRLKLTPRIRMRTPMPWTVCVRTSRPPLSCRQFMKGLRLPLSACEDVVRRIAQPKPRTLKPRILKRRPRLQLKAWKQQQAQQQLLLKVTPRI